MKKFPYGLPPEDNKPKITDQLRKDWNAYLDYLDTKKMRGSAALDKGGVWAKMIDEYRTVNPKTTITKENIRDIQQELKNYRDWSLKELDAKRIALSEGTTRDNYLKDLSIIDGIAGQRTTSYRFPMKYMTTFVDGKNTGTQNLGFATIKP